MGRIACIMGYGITWLLFSVAFTESSAIPENDVCTSYTLFNEQYTRCSNYNPRWAFDTFTGNGIRDAVRVRCTNATDIINCMTSATADCQDAAFIRAHVERLYSFCGSDNWFANDVDPVLRSGDLITQECHELLSEETWLITRRSGNPSISVREGIAVFEHEAKVMFNYILGFLRRQIASVGPANCTMPLRGIFLGWVFRTFLLWPALGFSLDTDLQNSISNLMAE